MYKHIRLGKEGFFTYSSGRMFNPADAVFLDHISSKSEDVQIIAEEVDRDGRFKRISGFID